jgi:hypothetical protein
LGTHSLSERIEAVSRKTRVAAQITDHADSSQLWHGAGWRLLVTAILLATISGLILLAGSLEIG